MVIAVAGNGAIGCLLVKQLLDMGEVVHHFCDIKRSGSASNAAGAMLNVFSEIDIDQLSLPHLRLKLEAGVESLEAWSSLSNYNLQFSNIVRDGFFIRKDCKSDFEQKQRDYLLGYVKNKYPEYILETQDDIYLPKEKYVDSRDYLSRLDYIISQSKDYFAKDRLYSNDIDHITDAYVKIKVHSYSHLFLCLGSHIHDLKHAFPYLFDGCQDVFHGLGGGLICLAFSYMSG